MVRPANFTPFYGSDLGGAAALVAVGIADTRAWKQPARAATTANVTIAGDLNAGDTIDGVTLAAGDRVLVCQQSAAAQNGVYQVAATPGRALDFDGSPEIIGAFVPVLEGTVNAGTVWRNTNTATLVVDTDDITFEEWPPIAAAIADAVASWEHAHILNLAFSGDGSTTAFELPAAPVDADSVAAYVAGVRTAVTLSGALLTTMTFGSAPASATDNITVDIVAALA